MNQKNLTKILAYKSKWDYFKSHRKLNDEYGPQHHGYLTMIQREAMLDNIFKLTIG